MKPTIPIKAIQAFKHVMDSEDEGLEEDGFVLHQDDILQVIELGDEQPLNGEKLNSKYRHFLSTFAPG